MSFAQVVVDFRQQLDAGSPQNDCEIETLVRLSIASLPQAAALTRVLAFVETYQAFESYTLLAS